MTEKKAHVDEGADPLALSLERFVVCALEQGDVLLRARVELRVDGWAGVGLSEGK